MPRLWKDSLLDAIGRLAIRTGSSVFTRQDLIKYEMKTIVVETGTTAGEPNQSLSYALQQLGGSVLIEFLGRGQYRSVNETIDLDTFDGTEREMDDAIKKGRLLIRNVPTANQIVVTRRRWGQDRLRTLALENYKGRCALCDVQDNALLITSHIVPWSMSETYRGDLANILILCRPHDCLFELGYWSLDDNLCFLVKQLDNSPWILRAILPWNLSFSYPVWFPPGKEYLKQHREQHSFFT